MHAERAQADLLQATAAPLALAEGPLWDAERARLLWVDILGGTVLEGVLEDGRLHVVHTHAFDEMVGAVVPARDGSLLVAAQEEIVHLSADGYRRPLARVVPPGRARRLNDGGVDPAGRFLVGTLDLQDRGGEGEVLVRLEADGSLRVLDDDLTLSNGLAWSADGTVLFSVDTLRRSVYRRAYDVATGEVGARRTHLVVDGGYPDGIAMDAEDHLWVAVWGDGEVRRFDPAGQLVATVRVPAPHTSSVAFAGPDLRTLVITTATKELDDDQLRAAPGSGHLFTTRVGVPGLSASSWAGPTTTRSTP